MVGSIFKPGVPLFAVRPGAPSAQVPANQPGTVQPALGVVPPVPQVAAASAMASFGLAEQQIKFQRALADPALGEAYRDLLTQLYSELAASEQPDIFAALDATQSWPLLRQALIAELVRFEYHYAGKSDIPVVGAIRRVLAVLVGRAVVEPLIYKIADAADAQRLQNSALLERRVKAFDMLRALVSDMHDANIGEEREDIDECSSLLGGVFRDLYFKFQAIDEHTLIVRDVDRTYPELSPEWKKKIVDLHEGDFTDISDRGPLWAAIRDSYLEFLSWVKDAVSDDEAQNAAGENGLVFMSIAQSVITIALQNGDLLRDLRALIADVDYPHLGRPVTLQELADGNAVMVSPEHLPPEVLEVLTVTGYLDEFIEWVDHVVLVDQIRLTEQQQNFIGTGADALADILGKMTIAATHDWDPVTNTLVPIPEFILKWKLASQSAVHEPRHIEYMSTLPADKKLLAMLIQSGPNEHYAYGGEADVCRRWLDHLKQTEGDDTESLTLRQRWNRLALEQHIFERETLIYAMNLMLGVELEDTTPGKKDFRVPDWLDPWIESIDRMNLNDYPTKVRELFGRIEDLGEDADDTQAQLDLLRMKLVDDLSAFDQEYKEFSGAVLSGQYHAESLSEQEKEQLGYFLSISRDWASHMASTLGLG